jgi:23S rRNA pseudouridine2605 synthase
LALIRLQKLIARYSLVSRRKAETLISAGRVFVNGKVVSSLGVRVPEDARIEVDGVIINRVIPAVYLMLHKPAGYLCTRDMKEKRPVIYDLLPDKYTAHGLFSVGRLDFMSEGLILMTNDGNFANAVAHPSGGIEKKYRVWTNKNIPYKTIAAWKNGIYIKGEQYRINAFQEVGAKEVVLSLLEGKNREIRKLFDSIGLRVIRIIRIAIGSLELGSLSSGRFRELSREELQRIYQRTR